MTDCLILVGLPVYGSIKPGILRNACNNHLHTWNIYMGNGGKQPADLLVEGKMLIRTNYAPIPKGLHIQMLLNYFIENHILTLDKFTI